MKDIKNIFRNLEKKLKQSKWFEEDWEIYNRGPYLQLYKTSWHNHNQGGIHFETYIEASQIKQKSFPICLHAEEDCPSRTEFIQRLLDREEDTIKAWKGYQIIAKDYHILQKTMPLNFKNLEQRLYDELNQLRKLAPSIELVLQELEADTES
ncbi:hypothetical protein [Marinomonas sp. THO17]|uniref:hypothetical protein n=1 Tax=Marinomonas sp. THO17 TaxID=3149048 RepID=UPI00336BC46F